MFVKSTFSFLFALLIFLVPGENRAQSQTPSQNDTIWTLERCIDLALKNNLTIRGGQLTVRDNEIMLTQSKADLFPTLNAGGGYQSLWGRSIDPTSNQFVASRIQSLGFQGSSNFLIYGGSRRRNTMKQDKTLLMATNYDLETDKNNVMLDVTNAFLNVILDTELLENAKVQLNTTQTQLENTSKQVKAGALPYSNELDLQAQVESNKVQVISAENDLRIAKLRLKQLLLIPSGQAFAVKIPDLSNADMVAELMPPDQIYAAAEDIMPQVKSADLNVKSAELGIKIARGGLDPSISASANIYSNYSSLARRQKTELDANGNPVTESRELGYVEYNNTTIPIYANVPVTYFADYPMVDQFRDNRSQSIGLSLSIPIFNGLTSRTNYQRARIQSERADLQAQQVRLQLRQNIELAYNNALAASQTYEASKKQVTSLEESFRAIQKSYDLGARSYFDYQVASNNLFAARSDLLRAKYNFIFTQKVLDFYIGKPLTLDN